MAEVKNKDQMEAYSEAVKSGLYAKKSGLVGKYDNVRRVWEDEITRQFLWRPLRRVIDHCRGQMRRVRIMDLGCGGADGYELLAGIRDRDADLEDVEVDLLTPDVLGLYKGVDLNTDLLDQARGIFGNNPKMLFEQADFTQGLPLAPDEEPYDFYFTSFGTCSHHNDDQTLINLLAEIAQRTKDYSLIVCDWLGRYSYEWQTLWTNDLSEYRNMDYVVSYIYDKEEREARRDELQHLNLRLVSQPEAKNIVAEAGKKAGVEIKTLNYCDRSVFTGRHMDTAEYNPHAQPIREAVNSLHEVNLRTNLDSLIIDYVPRQGFDFLNTYLEHLQVCWNTLVKHTAARLSLYDEETRKFTSTPPGPPAACPDTVKDMVARMEQVIEDTGWLGMGLPRENIIEPQLGYALRRIVTQLQQGQGCGHGLMGIFEVDKR